MKFKSFILLSFIILMQMLSLSMCEKEQHTIMFDSLGGSEVSSQVVSNGGFVSLPSQPFKIGYKFMGWYNDQELTERFLSSQPITKDITVYAKWELVEMPALSTLLLNENYKYDLDYVIDGTTYLEHYEYSPNVLKQTFNEKTEYLITDEYSYYLMQNGNMYFAYDQHSSKFSESHNLFFSFLINEIDPSNWYLDEFTYRPIEECFNEEVSKLLGYYETVKDITLYINYNNINCDIIFTNNIKYHIVLYYLDDFTVTIPDYQYVIEDEYIPIEEVLEKNNNQIVTINAAVYADLGEYYYALDNSGGLFIKKDNLNFSKPFYYKIKGVVKKVGNFSYLDSIISYEKNNTYIKINPTDILSPRNITLENLNIITYFNNYIVSSIETIGHYQVITVKFEDETGKIVLHESLKNNKDISINDIISVQDGVLHLFNNEPVIYLTSNSNLSFGEITVVDIDLPSTISVEQGTSYESFISSLVVKAIYNNDVEIVLDSSKYTINSNVDLSTVGEYELNISCDNVSKKIKVFVTTYNEYGTYDNDATNLDTLINENDVLMAMPRTGNANILVIPILFPDYNSCPNMKSNLEKAFFGSIIENGYYSLSEYYSLSSFGKLNITGDVVEPFTVSKNSSYYQYHENGDGLILEEALNYYEQHLDLTDYDGNSDGVIDGIYLIYNHPTDSSNDSFWWAYVTNNQNHYKKYDNMYANYYCFAGYEFIEESLSDGTNININSTTYIHETGHMLGLTDYYDYDESKGISGGLGGGDMMDHNVGDHNPFSKALLGWVTPLILEKKDMTFELESFAKTGECCIIPYSWNGSYFDEYLIIDYYTPTNLYHDMAGINGLFNISGLRIYHIQATTKHSLSGLLSIFKNDNSYTSNKLITLIENDMSNAIGDDNLSTNDDLFDVLDVFDNFKWSDGTLLDLSITVNSKTNDTITLTINVK